MLDSFLKIVGDYGNPVPRFTGQRCIVERMAVGGCDLCQQICPHDAVTIGRSVEISDKACTGCGLCTQVCPTGALEFDVTAQLSAAREQEEVATLVCSQSNEAGKTLPCLARVTPSLIVAAGGWDKPLELVRGDCAACSVGGPEVPAELDQVIETGQRLRAATGRPARVTVRLGEVGRGQAEAVSRRGMFGAVFRSARSVAAELVPEKPLPFVDWSEPQERVPQEWLWRRRALRPRPAPDTPVHWPAPTVDESCIFCPVCANVCPTEAITREVGADGNIEIRLDLAACTGCGACARSCPPEAIHMRGEWPEAAFDEILLLRASAPEDGG